MSFRPGLLASSSRTAQALVIRSTLPAARFASSSTTSRSKGASVQSADEQIREQEKALRRMPPGLEMSSLSRSYIMEPFIDPKFQYSWIVKKGVWGYIWTKIQRWATTSKASAELINDGIVSQPAGPTRWRWLNQSLRWRRRTVLRDLFPELESQYVAYNTAQAAGDARSLRSVSMGPAFERASVVASSVARSPAQWKIVETNAPAEIMSVRVGPIDPFGKENAAQVVVKYDTTQALTSGRPPKTKQMRIVEYVVFERRMGAGAQWLVKDKAEQGTPDFVKEQ